MPTQPKCTVPPPGWLCTHKAGHPGPCSAIQATSLALVPETPLTEDLIKSLGFEHEDHGDDPPYDSYIKDGIQIWDFNDLYWIVNMLDQGGIDVEFKTLGQLDLFFRACGKSPLI